MKQQTIQDWLNLQSVELTIAQQKQIKGGDDETTNIVIEDLDGG